MGLHYYHVMLEFCEMDNVFEGIFRVFLYGKYFFGFFLWQSIFLGSSEIPNSADPCL